MIDAKLITTAQELPGYRITRNLGVVRGIIVRSRSIVGNIGASLQTLFGGNITIYTELCEQAREVGPAPWRSTRRPWRLAWHPESTLSLHGDPEP